MREDWLTWLVPMRYFVKRQFWTSMASPIVVGGAPPRLGFWFALAEKERAGIGGLGESFQQDVLTK